MKASMTFIFIFLIMMSLCVVNTQPVEATEDSWATKAEMPTARGGFGVAVVNGKIYAIGGYNLDSGYLSTNEEYDPATDTWTTKEPMPTPRTDLAIAVYQNKIYVIGGHRSVPGGYQVFGTNEVYDPLTDTWETKTSMPTNRSMLCANVVNGKIYLIGGGYPTYLGIGRRDTNEVYDPLTDSWTTKTPMSTAEFYYASAVVDNKIYVMSYNNLTQIYGPETDTWVFGKPMPTSVSNAAAGATTGDMAPKRIYVIGGGTRFSLSTGLVQVYDPEEDVWDTGTSMPTPRSGLCVAVVNDVLYAIGGSRPPITAVNEQFTPFGYTGVHGTIYIRSDGSIDPDTASIQRDGNVYTLTGDISDSIVVEKDNIVVDGAGYFIEGLHSGLGSPPDGYGILVEGRRNVTISNVAIQHFFYGICLNSSSKNRITRSNITNNSKGIYIENSSDNIVRETQITNNTDIGIYVFESPDTNIVDNLIGDNANDGISLFLSSDNCVNYCDIRDNGVGIRIINSSIRPLIDSNITNNSIGIHLEASSVVIQFNNIANNGIGIQLAGSDNRIDHNNFINNTKQVYDVAWDNPGMSPSVNTWYEGDTGNYWSDYNGTGPYVIDENNQDNFPTSEPFRIPYEPWLPDTEIFLITNWIFWGMIIAAIVGTALLVYFRKIRKTTGKTEIISEGVM